MCLDNFVVIKNNCKYFDIYSTEGGVYVPSLEFGQIYVCLTIGYGKSDVPVSG